MPRITKSFLPEVSFDIIEDVASTMNYCSWERLIREALPIVIGIKPGEKIIGVEANDSGLKIIIKKL